MPLEGGNPWIAHCVRSPLSIVRLGFWSWQQTTLRMLQVPSKACDGLSDDYRLDRGPDVIASGFSARGLPACHGAVVKSADRNGESTKYSHKSSRALTRLHERATARASEI